MLISKLLDITDFIRFHTFPGKHACFADTDDQPTLPPVKLTDSKGEPDLPGV